MPPQQPLSRTVSRTSQAPSPAEYLFPAAAHSPSSTPSLSNSTTPQSHHPLSQPPLTASPSHSANPSPALPFLPLPAPQPPHIASLRGALARRRSSYPPSSVPSGAHSGYPWVMGGTPPAERGAGVSASATASPVVKQAAVGPQDPFEGFGTELTAGAGPGTSSGGGGGSGWTPGGAGWESLLGFEHEWKASPSPPATAAVDAGAGVGAGVGPGGVGTSRVLSSSNLATAQPIFAGSPETTPPVLPVPRAQSDPLFDHGAGMGMGMGDMGDIGGMGGLSDMGMGISLGMDMDLFSIPSGPSAGPSTLPTTTTAPSTAQRPILQPPPFTSATGTRQPHLGLDLEWRTVLSSVVDVDGVGQVEVIRVLQEVWKRGGGDSVTALCLWPSIIVALNFAGDPAPNSRTPAPSAQSAMSLQHLYNLTIRHWEPAIFSGMLGLYASGNILSPPIPAEGERGWGWKNEHYGPSTPMRETDVAQWINLTPGAWAAGQVDGYFAGGHHAMPSKAHAPASVSAPAPAPAAATGFPFIFEPRDERRSSLSRGEEGSGSAEEQQARGIDEILATMEEGQEEKERELVSANFGAEKTGEVDARSGSPTPTRTLTAPAPTAAPGAAAASQACSRQSSTTLYHLPTPDTDSASSPRPPTRRDSGKTTTGSAFSPVSMASPFVSAGSSSGISIGAASCAAGPSTAVAPADVKQPATSSALTAQPTQTKPASQKPRPTGVPIPRVDFIPPPPMCMFFNKSFEDLTQGKAGIWKGDLEVRGRGGGKFNVLVIGDQGTEHLWQSHLWPQALTYPLKPSTCESYTSSMIPVSHLAAEGLVPITMGMVLCNEPADRIDPYVRMVHGLHAEGVAFHLPCETRLPIVFLPAKFHASDPLLRLGIAFMGKAGLPYPAAPLAPPGTVTRGRAGTTAGASVKAVEGGEGEGEPKKKKRRQSAPVPTSRGASASANAGTGAGVAGREKRRGSKEKQIREVEEEGEGVV
ncbi:hypothetical protein IAT38_002887 [Cryptococcus sp. DSM 104549]